ncbi:MAG: hypothetical protein RJA70_1055 [Pseudomonadota bacterium]|jgi:membrane dipeptidase
MRHQHAPTFHPWSGAGERGFRRLGWGLVVAAISAVCALVVSGWHLALAQDTARFGVVDLHVDLPYQVNYKSKSLGFGTGQYVAEWLASSGVTDVVMPLYVPRDVSPSGPRMRDLEESFARVSTLLPATKPYRVGPCMPGSGVSAHFSLEGAEPLGFELREVERWMSRLRLVGLVHTYDTAIAGSSGSRQGSRDFGLTRRGQELVRRIHAYGGITDISHASDAAFADAHQQALAAGRPLVASHSNTRALADHPRNLTDVQLRAIAQTGGVIGINFHSPFLVASGGRAELDDVVRHIQHAVAVAGIDHVAIGSDFEGGISPPTALSDVRGFPKLAASLLAAGLSRGQVAKVFGLNARRVLCDTRT